MWYSTSAVPHIAASVFGIALSRIDSGYVRMSRAVTLMLCARFARELCRILRPSASDRIAAYVLGRDVPPYEGVERASWAAEQMITIVWYVAIAWIVLESLRVPKHERCDNDHDIRDASYTVVMNRCHRGSKRESTQGYVERFFVDHAKIIIAASSFVFFFVEIYLAYPAIRGRTFESMMVCMFFTSLALQLFSFADYVIKWKHPDATRIVALLLASGSVADALVQWASGMPIRDAGASGPAGMLTWSMIGAVDLWAIVVAKSRPS